jgi:2-polyprenyl-3-methyl-5-hydroxy-6-metoxy-1,4-benzoquinol methylase
MLAPPRAAYYALRKHQYTGLARIYLYLRLLVCPFEKIEAVIPKNTKKLLDIGAGYGIFADYLATKRKQLRIYASEYDASRVAAAQSRISSRVQFVTKSATDETYKGYDCVTIIDVIHHLSASDQEKLFVKLHRELSTGSRVIVKDIAAERSFQYYWNLTHDKLMTRFEPVHYRSDKGFRSLFAKHKFTLMCAERIPHPFYPHVLYVLRRNA